MRTRLSGRVLERTAELVSWPGLQGPTCLRGQLTSRPQQGRIRRKPNEGLADEYPVPEGLAIWSRARERTKPHTPEVIRNCTFPYGTYREGISSVSLGRLNPPYFYPGLRCRVIVEVWAS